MTIPIIDVTNGAVPDRHAARVVIEMTRWLDNEAAKQSESVNAHRRMLECGSPIAQERFATRMAKAFGYTLLDQKLRTGKKGRYRLDTHIWVAPPPDFKRHCVGAVLLTIESQGGFRREYENGKWHRRQNRQHRETPTFMVAGHALQRIAQRLGVKTPMDLLVALRALGRAVLEDEVRICGGSIEGLLDNREALLAGTQKLPFDGGVAVLRRDEDEDIPIVVTVLPQ